MELIELIIVLSGACVVLLWLAHVFTMVAPKVWSISGNFFTSVGKWAVITGGSEGIGKAYAEEFARLGLNVVIISRSKEKLDKVSKDIEVKMDRNVMVIAADFTKDDIYEHIKKNIQDLDIAVLVNNVGILPSIIPCKLLETAHLEKTIHQMINCNVKAMVKYRCATLSFLEWWKEEGASSSTFHLAFPKFHSPCTLCILLQRCLLRHFHEGFQLNISPTEFSSRVCLLLGSPLQ